MKYKSFDNKSEAIQRKLIEFHRVFQKKNKTTLGDMDFSKPLIAWVNKIYKAQCGLCIGDKFRSHTIWSKMHGPKNGALFDTYFRADRYLNGEQDKVGYNLLLSTHNTQADTDMSDGIIMHINFEISRGKYVTTYSYVF